jgi:hypothetical protein
LHIFVIGLVIFFCASYTSYQRGLLVPGTWYYENIMRYFPGGPGGYIWVQNYLGLPLVVGSHAIETLWLVGRMRKYRVRGGVWWAWVGSCVIEGFGAHQRFGEAVRRAEEKRTRGH